MSGGTPRKRQHVQQRGKAQMAEPPEWLMRERPAGYVAAADIVPALHGRLNPLNAYVAYFSGALMTEAGGELSLLVQWWFGVMLLALLSTGMRFAWFRRARVSVEPTMRSVREFLRVERGAWLDVHISLQALVLAGVCAQPAALAILPVLILFRVVWSLPRVQALPAAHIFRRFGMSIATPVALLALVMFAVQAGAAAVMKGWTAGLMKPYSIVGMCIAFASAYFLYVAPGLLLLREGAREMLGARSMSEAAYQKLRQEQKPEVKARKRKDAFLFTIASTAALAISPMVGNEAPVVAVFALQLARVSPSKLIDVLIYKGNTKEAVESGETPRIVRVQERAAWIRRWRGRRAKEALQSHESSQESQEHSQQDREEWGSVSDPRFQSV